MIYYFNQFISEDECKIVYYSYLHQLVHLVRYTTATTTTPVVSAPTFATTTSATTTSATTTTTTTTTIPTTSTTSATTTTMTMIEEESLSSLFSNLYKYKLLSKHTCRGKATCFIYNPEKELIIIAHPKIVKLFQQFYETKMISTLTTGFFFFSSEKVYGKSRIFYDMNSTTPSVSVSASASVSLIGFAIIQSSSSGKNDYSISILRNFSKYADYFKEQLKSEEKKKKLSYLPRKLMDMVLDYNHPDLKWETYFLSVGDLIIFEQSMPYFFEKHPSSSDINNRSPLIAVDLKYIPISSLTKKEIQQNAIAFLNRTNYASSMISNRMEKIIVDMTSPYTSPFVVNDCYWNTIPNPNLSCLRGLEATDGSISLWE
jgi:hypothetical protein